MQQAHIDSIKASPAYQRLITSRGRFSFTLTALMIITYYGFILFVALASQWLQSRGDVSTRGRRPSRRTQHHGPRQAAEGPVERTLARHRVDVRKGHSLRGPDRFLTKSFEATLAICGFAQSSPAQPLLPAQARPL
jgi:hypothetical protein